MAYIEKYKEWLENSYFDEETKKELLSIENNEKEIEDRFYKNLEFGTGGLRGVIGAGTNRINKYTVRRATYGLGWKHKTSLNEGIELAYNWFLEKSM